MELSDELLEQIGAYLANQMTATEKAGFENRLRQDDSLRQEVATQREIKQGLAFLAQKERFKTLHTDLEKRGLLTPIESSQPETHASPQESGRVLPMPTERTGFRRSWSYLAVAASLVLVFGVSWVLYRNWSEQQEWMAQNDTVFRTFFSPVLKQHPLLPNDPDRVAAPAETQSPRADSLRLTEAISLLQQNSDLAISRLNLLANGTPGHWSATAQWYLALAYLKTNRRDEARAVIERMTGQNGHPYQSEARTLLAALRKKP